MKISLFTSCNIIVEYNYTPIKHYSEMGHCAENNTMLYLRNILNAGLKLSIYTQVYGDLYSEYLFHLCTALIVIQVFNPKVMAYLVKGRPHPFIICQINHQILAIQDVDESACRFEINRKLSTLSSILYSEGSLCDVSPIPV